MIEQDQTGVIFLPGTEGIQHIALNKLTTVQRAGFTGGIDMSKLRRLNKTYVSQLAVTDSSEWPPIELCHINDLSKVVSNYGMTDDYVIIDGLHRYNAAIKKKQGTIASYVRTYHSEEEVVIAFLSANVKHGQPANKDTRTMLAMALYETDTSLTYEDIAEQVGLSVNTVRKAINSTTADMVEESEIDDETPEQKEVRLFCSSIRRFYSHQQDVLRRFTDIACEEDEIEALAMEVIEYISFQTYTKREELKESFNTLVKVLVQMRKR